MRILVYGGSFNPPHNGHIRSVKAAAAALSPGKILLIPTSVPPHKDMAIDSPSPEERLEMVRLAASFCLNAQVLDIELQRPGKSYTSDTLQALKNQYPEDELVFLLGTDMLLSLDSWHDPETIFSLASIALFARCDRDQTETAAKIEWLQDRFGGTIYAVPGEPVEISSTELRMMLPKRQGCDLIPAPVYAYIIRRRLYGAKPKFEWLREQSYAYLKQKRVAHVQGVEQEARRLAKRWNVNIDDAAEAAICHDITKKLKLEEQLHLCDIYGIIPDDIEKTSEKLLHAKTGAVFAGDIFGLSEPVIEAIRWHTTGRSDMTDLERVIYLADYIEPGREGFDGLLELRQAAYEDLDAAMELAMRMSITEVRTKGSPVHPNTEEGWRWHDTRLRKKDTLPIHATGIPDWYK